MRIRINKNEKKDYLKFKSFAHDREVCIHQGSKKEIENDFAVNRLVSQLHPESFSVRVTDIILENGNTKTFLFEPCHEEGTIFFPNYQPGQYLTLEVSIGDRSYIRPYTISCSPKKLSQLQITVKQVLHGVVSNYLFQEAKIGDVFIARGPFGQFVYQPLRDAKHIIAICGGSGITPIMAMAESILDGLLDIEMTILYGAKKKDDLLFKSHLDEMVKKCNKLQIIYILSEEEDEWIRSGFITKELILEVQKEENSYFICGPNELYERMNLIFKELNIANKYIRHDDYRNFQIPDNDEQYEIRVLTAGKEKVIYCRGNETLLMAMEREGISSLRRCGVGVCGFCRSKLLDGMVVTNYDFVRVADQKYRYIHPCSTYPVTDLVIQLPF